MTGYVPAFPSPNGASETGMTKREYIATQVFHAYVGDGWNQEQAAKRAVIGADLLLKELAK